MRILIVGSVALALGLVAGALYGGSRLKDELLAERSVTAEPRIPTAPSGPQGRPSWPSRESGGDSSTIGGDPAVVSASNDSPGSDTAGAGAGADSSAVSVVDVAPSESPPGGADGSAPVLPADSAATAGAVQLARMFSVMRPADAAAVLQELNDAEVSAILKSMQSRLAGQILGAFEPNRAALLSRTVLNAAGGS